MRSSNIKIGLIGCGQMGNYYAHNISKREDVNIAACCDPSPDKLKAFCEKWNIKTGTLVWSDIVDGSMGDLDGIFNCTVDSLHEDIFTASLESGLALFSEKPLAVPLSIISSLDSDKLIERPFVINFSKRNIPAVLSAQKFITGGGLGKLNRLEFHYRQGWVQNHDFGDWRETSAWSWRLKQHYSHFGVLGDLGSHLLDLAVLFGGPVKDIYCNTNTFPKVPSSLKGYDLNSIDEAQCLLNFENNASGFVDVTRIAPGEKDGVTILISGEQGSIKMDLEKNKNSYDLFMVGDLGWKSVSCSEKPRRNHDAFIDVLKGLDVKDAPCMDEAIQNQTLIEAAVKSSETGVLVNLGEFTIK